MTNTELAELYFDSRDAEEDLRANGFPVQSAEASEVAFACAFELEARGASYLISEIERRTLHGGHREGAW